MEQQPAGYGQYCPIAYALEILGDRWTLLIVRDVLVGTDRFNDLARGLPGISRSLLSRRLRRLRQAGVVVKVGDRYEPTAAGRELEPIVFGLGEWGARWAFDDPREDEVDPELLLWWAHTRVDTTVLPDRRLVVAFAFDDHPLRAWFVIDDAGVSLCKTDPGFTTDVYVDTSVRTLARVWLGRAELAAARRAGHLSVTGPRGLVEAFCRSLQLSPTAGMVRRALVTPG